MRFVVSLRNQMTLFMNGKLDAQNHRRWFSTGTIIMALLGLLSSAQAQHGVTREYAAFDPKPNAVPLAPLFDVPLTDASITLGPDRAFYLTGSAVENGAAGFSSRLTIWRSKDMKNWTEVRILDLSPGRYRSPEIHFMGGIFWLTLGRQNGGTELVKFVGQDLAKSAFTKAMITERGEDPSIFRDQDGSFY